MNANDLDRRLTDWLGEGPTSAPEPSIIAALGHARAHPRRPDPLAILRRDPMGTSGGIGFGLRALPVIVPSELITASAARWPETMAHWIDVAERYSPQTNRRGRI